MAEKGEDIKMLLYDIDQIHPKNYLSPKIYQKALDYIYISYFYGIGKSMHEKPYFDTLPPQL